MRGRIKKSPPSFPLPPLNSGGDASSKGILALTLEEEEEGEKSRKWIFLLLLFLARFPRDETGDGDDDEEQDREILFGFLAEVAQPFDSQVLTKKNESRYECCKNDALRTLDKMYWIAKRDKKGTVPFLSLSYTFPFAFFFTVKRKWEI